MSSDSLTQLDKLNQDLFDTYCSTCKDLFKENLRDLGLTEPLRRLVLIGKLKYAERNEVKYHHNEMIKSIEKNITQSSTKPSGLIIIDKCFFYHIVEGSEEVLDEVIKETANFASKEFICGAKVIRTLPILYRFFETWNSCVILHSEYVDLPTEETFVNEESDIPKLALMINRFEDVIFVLASYIRFSEEGDVDENINDLVTTCVLPLETELQELYTEPFFLTVQKYVERYLLPRDYTSYIEQECPPTGPVHDARGYFKEIENFEKNIDETLKIEEELQKKKSRYGTWWWSTSV